MTSEMEKAITTEGFISPMALDSISPTMNTFGTIHSSSPSIHLQVINAIDGILYELDVSSRSSVNVLRQEIVLKSGIPCEEQILLYGPPYARLDPKKSIESYQINLESTNIFVYDRRVLSMENPPIPRVVLHPQNVEVPQSRAPSSSSKVLQESSSPLLRALFDYETQFHQQYLMSEAIENTAKARLLSCDQCIEQLHSQSKGIQAALSNLETHHSAMQQRFNPFWKDFQTSSEDHIQLLENFDTYVNRLKSIPLHVALTTQTRSTLYDCIPIDREREWLSSCQQSHASLQSKMEGLATSYRLVSDTIASSQSEFHSNIPYDLTQQRALFSTKVAELSTMRQKLQMNYDTVTKRVAETTQQTMEEAGPNSTSMNMSFMFGSTHILEACRGLNDLFCEQAEILPAMQKHDEELKEFMNKVAKAKEEYFPTVFAQLKLVSKMQSEIVDFETHLGILRDALMYQKRQFSELKHIEKLPEAYEACIIEIKRRRQYGRLFQLQVNEMGEKMVSMREEEILKRERFLKEHGKHLPRDFSPGLTEKPSHCIVTMRPFDTNLPEIEQENDEINEPKNEIILLKEHCENLEKKIKKLENEIDEHKKTSCDCDDSYSNSSSLTASVETYGPKFPLVLALAATAGHNTMNNSSEILNEQIHFLNEKLNEKENYLNSLEKNQIILNEKMNSLQNWFKKIISLFDINEYNIENTNGLDECFIKIEEKWNEIKNKKWNEEEKETKIAFRNFLYNDLALFLPTFAPNDINAQKIYLAFHLTCPNRFLSDESIATFYQTQNRYPEYILGRIVYIDERIASERDNPYRLTIGTTFYVLTVTCFVEF